VSAAKPFLAGVLIALVCAAGAAADNPTVRIDQADPAKAVAALAHLTDFGAGWTGGQKPAGKLSAPNCPGFDPKESDLVVTGHAEAHFVYSRAGVTFDQDTQVLETPAAVKTDFSRTIRPELPGCLAYGIKHGSKEKVVSVAVHPLGLPANGDVSAAYRATIVFRVNGKLVKWISDSVFVGTGRIEYSLNVSGPAALGGQFVPFEQAMVQILMKRAPGGNVA